MKLENVKNKEIVNWLILVSYIAILLIGFNIATSKGGIAPYVMTSIAIIGAFVVYYLYSKINSFCCPKCKSIFKIGFFKAILSPNDPKGKFLKCPKCGYKGIIEQTSNEKK